MSYRTNADVVAIIDPGYQDPNNPTKIVHDYYTAHTEDGEFLYPRAFAELGRDALRISRILRAEIVISN